MPADARQLGIEALKAGRYADAAKHLSGFIGSAPNDQEARLAFALALSGRGDHAKALIHLDKLLTKTPNSAGLHFHRGLVLERAKRFDQARREFRRALELNPKHAKAQAKLKPAGATVNPGFEVIEDEPQFEVVEDDKKVLAAESIDEDIIETQLADETDDVIETDLFEEIWGDERPKKNDAAAIVKYCVLALAVGGAAVFGFYVFSQNLAIIFSVGMAVGATLLGSADYVKLHGGVGSLFWGLHGSALVILIATVVGVMLGHRAEIADDPRGEHVKAYPPSPDMARTRAPFVPQNLRTDDAMIDRIITDLDSGSRPKEMAALARLSVYAANRKRDEVSALLEKFLNKNETIYRNPALRAARIWGNRSLLPTLKRLANETAPGISQLAKDAIDAIEQQP